MCVCRGQLSPQCADCVATMCCACAAHDTPTRMQVLSKLQDTQPSSACSALPSTMYVLDNNTLDIRVARLQRRLGVTVLATTAVAAATPIDTHRQHQQLEQPDVEQQQPEVSSTGAPRDDQEQQQQFVVQCCQHPTAPATDTARASSHHSAAAGVLASSSSSRCFSDMQEAVMTVCMLEWMAAAATQHTNHHSTPLAGHPDDDSNPSGATNTSVDTRGCDVDAHNHHDGVLTVCGSCQLLQQLPAARQRLQDYLAQAGAEFERLLPQWLQLEALVMPDG